MPDLPETRYASAPDGVHIAYQVFGDGPVDLVVVPGFISHLDVMWENPALARAYRRLASLARVITFDKRGTGLSDRPGELPDVDQRMLDLQAVIDAVGLEQPAILGISEGGAMAIVFAATYPERVRALVLYGAYAMVVRTEDHPIGAPADKLRDMGEYLASRWGTGVGLSAWAPSQAEDPEAREWWARLQRLAASPGAAMHLLASYNVVDARGALPLVAAPTLVVHRTGDQMIGVELGRELAEGIPEAQMVEFPGDDHLLPTTNSDEIVDVIAEFLIGTAPEVEPDRRLATVLFTDIVSSTEHIREVGDAGWRAVLDEHDRLVQTSVQRYGGRVVKQTGDGALALFDGPTRAVQCARAITSNASSIGVGIRAGLHTGEIVERGEDVAGIAVHLAARVCAEADAGEVWVSRTLVDLVAGSDLCFDDHGEHQLKGIDGSWRLYGVSDRQGAPVRGAGATIPAPGSSSAVGSAEPARSAAPPDLRIRLLGEVRVEIDGAPLEGFATPRLARLLARLVLGPANQDRHRLAFELWPDSTESQALTNLRHALHDLRRSLPDWERFVEIDAHTVGWRPDAEARIDVVAFDDALARDALEEAVEIYGGELLPACYDDWVLAERDRLRTLAVDALLTLARRALGVGEPDVALRHGYRLVGIDPLCEPAYQALMEAHARRGERAQALRTYHTCVDVLDRELGVAPGEEIRARYAALRGADVATEQPARAAGAGSGAPEEMVGRTGDWSIAQAAAREAFGGRAHLLLATGEPGIGKTRLVDELARWCAAEGAAVVRTRAYEGAATVPWGAVVGWLRSDPLRSRAERLAPEWCTELARLLPELRTARPDVPSPGPMIDDTGRLRLLDALVQALLVEDRPLLLVIDDLQWCDAETIELVGYLLRAAPRARVLVAGTARMEELDPDHPLTVLRGALERGGQLTEVALEPLDSADVALLASRIAGRDLPPEVLDRLRDETEGNPLFLVESVRAGAMTGAASMPPTVRSVIEARFEPLSEPARAVVEVAAAIGREFSVEVLAEAAGCSVDDLVDALDELWQRRIVREVGVAYDFTHDKLREVAHDRISPARRRRIHRQLADALETLESDDLDAVSARLAVHYEEARLTEQAVRAWRRAADHALRVFSLDDAISSLRRALTLLEHLPTRRERYELELDLRTELGVPLVAREGYGSPAAVDTYERAVTVARHLGRPVDPSVLRGLGLAALVTCRFDRSSSFGQELLTRADADPTAQTEGHYLIGVSAFWRGDLATSAHHLEAAIDRYRPELRAEHLARYAQDPEAVCRVRLALTRWWSGAPLEARRTADRACRDADALDHPTSLAYVLVFSAILAAEADDRAHLAAQLDAVGRLWSHQRLDYFMAVEALLRAWLDFLEERTDATKRLAGVVEDWSTGGQPLQLSYGLLLLARAHLHSGDTAAGREAIAAACRWTDDHEQRYLEAELWRVEGELAHRDGDDAAAAAACRRALAAAEAQGARWYELRAASSLVRCGGGPDALDRLRGLHRRFADVGDLPAVREASGLLAGVP